MTLTASMILSSFCLPATAPARAQAASNATASDSAASASSQDAVSDAEDSARDAALEEELRTNDPGYSRLSKHATTMFQLPQSQRLSKKTMEVLNPTTDGKYLTVSPYTGATYTHSDVFKGMNLYHGIDVSYYQGNIDWQKVKADGIDFAIIRMGYRGYSNGTLVTDSKFAQNMQNAIAAGIQVGVYFFTEAVNTAEAVEEAEYVVNAIAPYNVTMPVAIDWEFNVSGGNKVGRKYTAGLSKAEYTAICSTFCDTVKSHGYTPMIYANKSDLSTYLDGAGLGQNYEIWLARYNTETAYTNPYSFWQYSASSAYNTGTVDGINGALDLNFWYTTGTIDKPTFTHGASASAVSPSPTPTEEPDSVNSVKGFASDCESKKITLSWNTVKNATGYQIYRKDTYNGSYKKIKTITAGDTDSWTNTGLAAKHEYYYRIRAYIKTSDGNIFSNFVNLTAATHPSYQVAVAKKKLTLMKKPAKKGARLITVKKGTSLVFDGRTFLKNGQKYLHVRYITTSRTYNGYLPTNASLKYYDQGTTTAHLNLRKKPGTNSALLVNIPKNTPIALLGTRSVSGTTWYKTTYSGKKGKIYNGYVSGNYIEEN